MTAPVRIGNGFDVHALVPGRALIVGGVRIALLVSIANSRTMCAPRIRCGAHRFSSDEELIVHKFTATLHLAAAANAMLLVVDGSLLAVALARRGLRERSCQRLPAASRGPPAS